MRVGPAAFAAVVVGTGALVAAPPAAAVDVVTVTATEPDGWCFSEEVPTGSGALVEGPAGVPAGSGSARFEVDGTGRVILSNDLFEGTPLADLDALSYATWHDPTSPGGDILAVSLQLDVDYDGTDDDFAYQGRLVFEPYYVADVVRGEWQTWDTLDGVWWASGAPGNALCPISAACSWGEILAAFPDAAVLDDVGALHLKAGGPWTNGFLGNADALTVGFAGGDATTWDFEAGGVVDCELGVDHPETPEEVPADDDDAGVEPPADDDDATPPAEGDDDDATPADDDDAAPADDDDEADDPGDGGDDDGDAGDGDGVGDEPLPPCLDCVAAVGPGGPPGLALLAAAGVVLRRRRR